MIDLHNNTLNFHSLTPWYTKQQHHFNFGHKHYDQRPLQEGYLVLVGIISEILLAIRIYFHLKCWKVYNRSLIIHFSLTAAPIQGLCCVVHNLIRVSIWYMKHAPGSSSSSSPQAINEGRNSINRCVDFRCKLPHSISTNHVPEEY